MKNLTGRLFGDHGTISKKLAQLFANQQVVLITTLKKNMKAQVMDAFDKLLLRKRSFQEASVSLLYSEPGNP